MCMSVSWFQFEFVYVFVCRHVYIHVSVRSWYVIMTNSVYQGVCVFVLVCLLFILKMACSVWVNHDVGGDLL